MKYLIKNGFVIDPLNNLNDTNDIFISDGKIAEIGKNLNARSAETIDATGRIVAPGLVDMHSHLREPGREDEETIKTGSRAAVRGGFTSVACMANTEPPPDNPKTVKMIKAMVKKDAACNVFIIGAASKNRAGKTLTNFGELKRAGVVAVSDDGSSIEIKSVMSEAFKKSKKARLLVIGHCEDQKLSAGGVVNKGFVSTKMGLCGIPREAEYEIVKRDLGLAKRTLAHFHIAHVSCKESVELIRKAKQEGVKVTAEVAPHHFVLTEDCCATYDTNTKMNPPLRTKEDVEAVKAALADGTIDVIATDHAPHTDSEKDVEFEFAPFGIIGLETALSLAAMELVATKLISWQELILKMSVNPSRILGINGGSLKIGAVADVTVIDQDKEYVYTKDMIESKSKNSPFINWKLKAKATHVFVNGKLMMKDELMVV